MTITPEQARDYLKEAAISARRIAEELREDKLIELAAAWEKEAAAFDWALSRIEELETQLADMRRDLSDARSGWESAVAEVLELED